MSGRTTGVIFASSINPSILVEFFYHGHKMGIVEESNRYWIRFLQTWRLQKLYDGLITQGSISSVEALTVGVLIEETDINDLIKAIATTQRKDIRTVYYNLLQGSRNHLNDFESQLAKSERRTFSFFATRSLHHNQI
jgi:Uncharacterized protein domain (DUF2202)